jgi:CRP-like cAMP-binding protein
MNRDYTNALSSPPCLLDQSELACDLSYSSPAITPLISALSRTTGNTKLGKRRDQDFPASVSRTFTAHDVVPGTVLAAPGQPWPHVYFIQYGILEMSRHLPNDKTTILEFFSEGALIWPVFEESKTKENTLSLSAATGGQVWAADFGAFRSVLEAQGVWERFALPLTEELADRALERESGRQHLPASERYQRMLEEYPLLSNRVPDHKLAAWLGMDCSTFSRIKNESSGCRQ